MCLDVIHAMQDWGNQLIYVFDTACSIDPGRFTRVLCQILAYYAAWAGERGFLYVFRTIH